jgi:hypothetical protein
MKEPLITTRVTKNSTLTILLITIITPSLTIKIIQMIKKMIRFTQDLLQMRSSKSGKERKNKVKKDLLRDFGMGQK